MKYIKKVFCLLVLLFVVSCLLSAEPIFAKDYSIASANFNVQLNPDGSAEAEARVSLRLGLADRAGCL